MAWTAPATFVVGATLTAAQLNTNVRDNLLETAPAKATTAGRLFRASGTNAIVEDVLSSGILTIAAVSITTDWETVSTSMADAGNLTVSITPAFPSMVLVLASVHVETNEGVADNQKVTTQLLWDAVVRGEARQVGVNAGQQGGKGTVAWMIRLTTQSTAAHTAKIQARIESSLSTGVVRSGEIICIAIPSS